MFSLWKDIEAFYDGPVGSRVDDLAGLVVLLAASIGVFVVVMYSFIVLSHLGWPVLGVFAALAVGLSLKYVVSRGRAIRNGHI